APLRRERFQRERDIVQRLDLADGYNATWEMLSGISLAELRGECEQFLRDTQAAWDETFPEFVKRVLHIEPREATRADALALFRLLRPHGGQTDWNTFLHELGHALHFAYMRADHPFEYRWLGDNSITESYAMLFDHRMEDAGWLQRYSQLGEANRRSYLRSAGFEELHFIRRYCAKLIYETHLYGGDVPWDS